MAGVPAKRAPKDVDDVGRQVRQWWKKKKLEGVLDPENNVGLARAISDVGVLSMAYLARRLCDDKTPDKVKDQIALVMAPKMLAESRGRPALPPRNARGGGDQGDGGLVNLLGDYGVRVRTG